MLVNTSLTSPLFFWHVLQFYLSTSNLEKKIQKYNSTLADNYVMANGSPNKIPNKGHLNLPCFVQHAKDGSIMMMVFQKSYKQL